MVTVNCCFRCLLQRQNRRACGVVIVALQTCTLMLLLTWVARAHRRVSLSVGRGLYWPSAHPQTPLYPDTAPTGFKAHARVVSLEKSPVPGADLSVVSPPTSALSTFSSDWPQNHGNRLREESSTASTEKTTKSGQKITESKLIVADLSSDIDRTHGDVTLASRSSKRFFVSKHNSQTGRSKIRDESEELHRYRLNFGRKLHRARNLTEAQLRLVLRALALNSARSRFPPPPRNVSLMPFRCAGESSWLENCSSVCSSGEGRVARLVHFVQVGGKFGFLQWVAVMSAIKFIQPQRVFIFTTTNLTGCWASRLVSHPLVEVQHLSSDVIPRSINGTNITEAAHKADFLRLSVLWQFGGIYMDTDAIATRSFHPFFNKEAVLAQQKSGAVGNGLIVTRQKSCFICSFAKTACSEFDGSWSRHSVMTLYRMLSENSTRAKIEFPFVVVLPHASGFFPV